MLQGEKHDCFLALSRFHANSA